MRVFRPTAQYGIAAALVVAATLVRLPLETFLHGRAPYGLYFPMLVVTAWLFGVAPTLFACTLSLLATWYFILAPRFSWAISKEEAASLTVFIVTATSLIALARWAARIRTQLAQLASIVSFSDDAIFRLSPDGTIQTWNAGAERIFGFSEQEIAGRPISVLIPSDRRGEEEDILARLRRGEPIDHYETTRVRKDARLIDVSLTISPIRDDGGNVVGISKVVRDISERKAAARALAEQQEWFRVTLASIGDAVITTDREGNVTFVNQVAASLIGYAPDEARGQPLASVFNIVNETTRQPVDSPVEKVLRSGSVIGLANHTALISRDGKERPIEDSAAPIIDDRKNTVGVVLVFHDVTARRQAEDALAEQREWLQTTLESIGDAVIATDIHSRVVFMNPVAEHLTGWNSREAKGRDCAEVFRIVNESTRATVESPVTRVLREGTVVGLANHTVLISRGGGECPIDDSAAPIRSRAGRVVGVVLVFHDVTERRLAERERRAAERDRERLLESERAARTDAERATRLKDEFLATVSHELRTPLNSILGWAQLLKAKDAAADATLFGRGLAVIERNTNLQAHLISDLLDMSRIISGKLLLELQVVDIAKVVEGAIEAARPSAGGKGISLERHMDPDVPPVTGDPSRLQQIVSNLVGNAIKFTRNGGRVTVRVQKDAAGTRIVVSDTGIGIKPEVLPSLFDRFRQADSSTTRRYGGLGLGLAIVRQLVELHGGGVAAHSEGEGKGATFTVTLPAAAAAARDGTDGLLLAQEQGVLRPSLPVQGVKVLLVEDDADTREVIDRILSEAGCRVVAVDSAAAAFEAIREDPPDIVLSDIGLPDEDGYSLIRKIRSLSGDAGSIPAIAVTAFARLEDRTRALQSGFQSHVSKPVQPAELLASVASFAEMVRSRGSGLSPRRG